MSWDWGTINQVADEALVTAGIGFLIVRQFLWRSAELRRMLWMPAIILGLGIVSLLGEVQGLRWVPADWCIPGELVLVFLTGTAMGYVTHLRTAQQRVQYKLTGAGIALWAVFLTIRIGSFFLASALGANLSDAMGPILLSFGTNRLAATLIVRRRVRRLITAIDREPSRPAETR